MGPWRGLLHKGLNVLNHNAKFQMFAFIPPYQSPHAKSTPSSLWIKTRENNKHKFCIPAEYSGVSLWYLKAAVSNFVSSVKTW